MNHLLIQIAVMLLFARILGAAAQRFRQPAVLGELLAGITLGPTVLGKLWPQAQIWLFPNDAASTTLLGTVARLGVLLLLLVTGFELDLGLVLSRGRRLLQVAVWGTLIPVLLGTLLGLGLPDHLLASPERRPIFAMFMAVAMSISAMAVLSKLLMDLGVMRRDLAQTMVATAMTEDLAGWIMLSFVAGLARGEEDPHLALRGLLGAALFLGLAFSLGRWLVDRILVWVDDHNGSVSMQISASIVFCMLLGTATHALGLEPQLGAMVAGMLTAQARRFRNETEHVLKLMVTSFLSPIFFASAGLKVDLLKVVNLTVLGWGFAIFGVACISKLVGVSLGAWRAGFSRWESAAFGIGLNARGSMEIIVATIGLNLGILAIETYSIIVLVAMGTCLLTPPLLRWAFAHIPVKDHELMREELSLNPRFLTLLRRVLLPMRGGPNAQAVAYLITCLARSRAVDVTVMHFDNPSDRKVEPDFDQLCEQLKVDLPGALTVKRGRSRQVIPLITRESRRGYQLMVLGASHDSGMSGSLFNQAVDDLLRESGCPVAVVRVPEEGPPLTRLRKILVPTTGTQANLAAIELAAALAAASQAELWIVHVQETSDTPRPEHVATSLLDDHTKEALRITTNTTARILHGSNSESELVALAQAEQFDLVVLRGSLRRISGRPYLGHRAERLLRQSPCPVMVLCSS